MSTIEERFLISVSRIRNLLFRNQDIIFRKNELTISQFEVLEVLLHKGGLCVKEIQEKVLGTNGNIPIVIKNLEKKGLVSRKKGENDARYSIIELTDEGKKITERVYNEQRDHLKNFLSGIDKELLNNLNKELFYILKNLDKKS